MPRLIDHEERDREIAAAAFAVLERDGLTALSVRRVAAEAGLAAASLRRAFPTQHALRLYCLELIRSRATERVRSLSGSGIPLGVAVLSELLPLDAARRLELTAQLQLMVLALTEPRLRDTASTLHGDVRRACEAVAAEVGLARPAAELHAFLDGLALHLLTEPTTVPPEAAIALLEDYLTAHSA
ncbi:TetR/AcrR family transcriptional regulator [Cnuibacter sp. UC19_7]|uniref:TetR/AcrR family transcriptional regulator n=1 Tax=Cnuibacter sp. UC19_7 TaxID=3350166 RepID=UPI00366B11D0